MIMEVQTNPDPGKDQPTKPTPDRPKPPHKPTQK
jgi:hypothetical protein